MKIVLINTYERRGGAAVACNRLAHALREAGVDAHMLAATAVGDDNVVAGACRSRWAKWWQRWAFLRERLQIFLCNGFSRKQLFTVSTALTGISIVSHPLVREADVIHLNWINQGYLSLHELECLLTLGKPVVWTMHDMWPVTAICHHARECNRYTTECRCCPFLASHGKDLSTRLFHDKQKIYTKAPLHFVACSGWLRREAEVSALLKPADTLCDIPNPIDVSFFAPDSQEMARKHLGLPLGKRLILFGAVNAADKRKGIDYLVQALQALHERYPSWDDKVELVVFGAADNLPFEQFPYRCTALGYLAEAESVRDMYRAADVYVTPSLEENLPNTIMEAMACGVPCVGFEVGGIPEMITEGCGYVARYKDAADMAKGIDFVLQEINHKSMSLLSRRMAEERYAELMVAQRYIALYKELSAPQVKL